MKKYDKPRSFRADDETDDRCKELFGMSISQLCKSIVDDVSLLDTNDIYDVRIFVNNLKQKTLNSTLKEVESNIEEIQKEKQQLDFKLKNLNTLKDEIESSINEIQKEKDEYISNKKKYHEKSLKHKVNMILLLYIKPNTDFNDSTLQELIYSFNTKEKQNKLIFDVKRYLEANYDRVIKVIDEDSAEKTIYSIKLDDKVVNDIDIVLSSLLVKKNL